MARIVPDNPSAFPPSMEVRWRRYEYRDAGVRATPGAVAENRVGNSGRGAVAGQGRGRISKAMLIRCAS